MEHSGSGHCLVAEIVIKVTNTQTHTIILTQIKGRIGAQRYWFYREWTSQTWYPKNLLIAPKENVLVHDISL